MTNKERVLNWAKVAGTGLFLICTVIVSVGAINGNPAYWVPSVPALVGAGIFGINFFKKNKDIL